MQSSTFGRARSHRPAPLPTRDAVEELGPEVGKQATARVTSTGAPIDRA